MGVSRSLARRCAAAFTVSAAALTFAAAALADATTSTNWAGYAIHGNGVTFRTVQGSWREPGATCTPGLSSYSSYWVGIGGYSQTSGALDQIGTEVDCTASGQVRSTAWYEMVPAGAVTLSLTAHPGDLMNAGVTVNGRSVSLSLTDVTRNKPFSRTFTAPATDVSSAEWIVEAPSECIGQNCQTLPLANFGTAAFSSASATSAAGRTAGIDDPAWETTKIKLMPEPHRLFGSNGATPLVAVATPTAVGTDDNSFKVAYSRVSPPTASQPLARVASASRPAELRQPGP